MEMIPRFTYRHSNNFWHVVRMVISKIEWQ